MNYFNDDRLEVSLFSKKNIILNLEIKENENEKLELIPTKHIYASKISDKSWSKLHLIIVEEIKLLTTKNNIKSAIKV